MAENSKESPVMKKSPSGLSLFVQKNVGLLVFFAVLIIFPFAFGWITGTSPIDGPSKYWQGQLVTFFILAVYAMSYDLLMGYTGILSFGHAAFYGIGAYTMAIFYKHFAPQIMASGKFSIAIGSVNLTEAALFAFVILLVLVFSVLLGLIFSAVAVRVKGVYFAMITLAMAEAIHILSKATDFMKWTGADEGLHGVPVPEWINPNTHRLQFYFIGLAFMIIMLIVLKKVVSSPTGRVMIAVRENESRVKMIGYNPGLYRSVAFIVSGMIAGLAGSMAALWNLGATPSMTGALSTINAMIITILGGVGTLVGPIIGAGIMQFISQFFYQWFGSRWPLVFGLLFIALVMFLPNGIVGTWRMKKLDLKNGWQRLMHLFTPRKADE